VAQRKREVKHCAVCDKEIEGYALKRFCSPACQVKDYRRRRREAMAKERGH
jgi:predicted nucleic acid-binding Zn ribbon protein